EGFSQTVNPNSPHPAKGSPTMTAQHTVPHLRRGAGKPDGSDGFCAMQVVSWENGDAKITDFPACADPALTRIVQVINDRICTHRSGGQLCPSCSIAVL